MKSQKALKCMIQWERRLKDAVFWRRSVRGRIEEENKNDGLDWGEIDGECMNPVMKKPQKKMSMHSL